MSIVTKSGDQGSTALMYNRRISKCHPRVESYGAVDHLNSVLGMARATASAPAVKERLLGTQKILVLLMGELATASQDMVRYTRDGFPRVNASHTARVENWVQELEVDLKFEGWAMPGENLCSAALEMARTACRTAERRVCVLLEAGELGNPEIIVFLNRLSDLLWLLARHTEKD